MNNSVPQTGVVSLPVVVLSFILGAAIVLRFFVPEAEKPVAPEMPPAATTTIAVEPPPAPLPILSPTASGERNRGSSISQPNRNDFGEIGTRIAEKKASPPRILKPHPPPLPKPSEEPATTIEPRVATTTPETVTTASIVPEIKVPPVDEEELMKAVVRIRCGNIYGSGFVTTPKGLVLTAAHVLMNAIESGIANCDVIFPRKHTEFGYYYEAHYRVGTILTPSQTEKFYKEQGLDVAALQTAFLDNDPVFPAEFPYIKYPFCDTDTLDDKILLFGYAANIGTSPTSLGSILSKFEGNVVQYGDVIGIRKEPSQIIRGGYDYYPDFTYTLDESVPHPAVIIAGNNNFSGASGGLVFDTSKNCIIGTNSAVATANNDPRVFGFIYNLNFPAIKFWFGQF